MLPMSKTWEDSHQNRFVTAQMLVKTAASLHQTRGAQLDWLDGARAMLSAWLQTLCGSSVKLGRSRLPASAWLSCSTSYMLYDGFPISTFMPPLVMGCLWTRLPLRRWLVNNIAFISPQFSGFILQMTELQLLLAASLFYAFSFICLPLPPSADVNTRYHHHNQDYQQDQRHDDSYAPWETDRRERWSGEMRNDCEELRWLQIVTCCKENK